MRKFIDILYKVWNPATDGKILAEEIKNLKENSNSVPILTSLPETDPSKAGQSFYYNGKNWEYLTSEKITANGWDEEVEIGEPFPVSGYKTAIIKVFFNNNNSQVLFLNHDGFINNVTAVDTNTFEISYTNPVDNLLITAAINVYNAFGNSSLLGQVSLVPIGSQTLGDEKGHIIGTANFMVDIELKLYPVKSTSPNLSAEE